VTSLSDLLCLLRVFADSPGKPFPPFFFDFVLRFPYTHPSTPGIGFYLSSVISFSCPKKRAFGDSLLPSLVPGCFGSESLNRDRQLFFAFASFFFVPAGLAQRFQFSRIRTAPFFGSLYCPCAVCVFPFFFRKVLLHPVMESPPVPEVCFLEEIGRRFLGSFFGCSFFLWKNLFPFVREGVTYAGLQGIHEELRRNWGIR